MKALPTIAPGAGLIERAQGEQDGILNPGDDDGMASRMLHHKAIQPSRDCDSGLRSSGWPRHSWNNRTLDELQTTHATLPPVIAQAALPADAQLDLESRQTAEVEVDNGLSNSVGTYSNSRPDILTDDRLLLSAQIVGLEQAGGRGVHHVASRGGHSLDSKPRTADEKEIGNDARQISNCETADHHRIHHRRSSDGFIGVPDYRVSEHLPNPDLLQSGEVVPLDELDADVQELLEEDDREVLQNTINSGPLRASCGGIDQSNCSGVQINDRATSGADHRAAEVGDVPNLGDIRRQPVHPGFRSSHSGSEIDAPRSLSPVENHAGTAESGGDGGSVRGDVLDASLSSPVNKASFSTGGRKRGRPSGNSASGKPFAPAYYEWRADSGGWKLVYRPKLPSGKLGYEYVGFLNPSRWNTLKEFDDERFIKAVTAYFEWKKQRREA